MLPCPDTSSSSSSCDPYDTSIRTNTAVNLGREDPQDPLSLQPSQLQHHKHLPPAFKAALQGTSDQNQALRAHMLPRDSPSNTLQAGNLFHSASAHLHGGHSIWRIQESPPSIVGPVHQDHMHRLCGGDAAGWQADAAQNALPPGQHHGAGNRAAPEPSQLQGLSSRQGSR